MSDDKAVRRYSWAGAAAVGTLSALSAGVVAVALATASGVTYVGNSSYETEFVNPQWWHVGWLLCVPVFAAAWRYPTTARLSVLGAAAPQWVGMWVAFSRYAESGFGSGLEGIGFVVPLGMTLLCLAVAGAGRALGTANRSPHDKSHRPRVRSN